uniref:Coiled-coil domain containing 106b n=1 Tax=Oryzias sinensis TaxID=183150 RepID=A0A8C7XQ56_9TELE
MNPPNCRHEATPPEHYEPQLSTSSAAAGGGGEGGGMYLNAYEVSFPLEDNAERPPTYHLNHGQQMMDEPGVQELPHPQYSPFILVSNLRAHLYVSLEKNSWLQKRIEELEEERNFLRCQLNRFIVSMSPEATEWCGDAQRAVKVQPNCSPSPPSPMTTRSGMTLKRLQDSGPRTRRNISVPGEEECAWMNMFTSEEGFTCSLSASVKQEFHIKEDKYYTEDEYVEEEEEEEAEEEEEDSSVEKGSKKKGRARNAGEPRMKMRRIFRITHGRERQRVKDPDGVLIRYKKILTTYQRVRSMSRAFQIHGVDRNTMASTSPIAELLLVAPEKVAEVGEFEASKEKLLDYARRCYKTMDEETHAKVQSMKKTHKLLPISYRFRN